jgi:hypothetical protein
LLAVAMLVELDGIMIVRLEVAGEDKGIFLISTAVALIRNFPLSTVGFSRV